MPIFSLLVKVFISEAFYYNRKKYHIQQGLTNPDKMRNQIKYSHR